MKHVRTMYLCQLYKTNYNQALQISAGKLYVPVKKFIYKSLLLAYLSFWTLKRQCHEKNMAFYQVRQLVYYFCDFYDFSKWRLRYIEILCVLITRNILRHARHFGMCRYGKRQLLALPQSGPKFVM